MNTDSIKENRAKLEDVSTEIGTIRVILAEWEMLLNDSSRDDIDPRELRASYDQALAKAISSLQELKRDGTKISARMSCRNCSCKEQT